MNSIASPVRSPSRIHSIDQLRGYTVLGMFVVNYLGHYPSHFNFHHNDYFLSYSDTIMPMFLFVVGITFRLTLVKKLATDGMLSTYVSCFKRCLTLCLISVILNGVGQSFDSYEIFFTDPQTKQLAEADWAQFEEGRAEWTIPPHFGDRVSLWARLFVKSYVWETLAVIGLTQLFVLPLVHLGFRSRLAGLMLLGAAHVAISQWFNWQFFYGYTLDGQYVDSSVGLNNWMGALWGTGSNRSWDGGVFGVMTWGVAMLAGTLCGDLISIESPRTSIARLVRWGGAFLIAGYAMSCLSRLYDLPDAAQSERFAPAAADERITNTRGKAKGGISSVLAASPVLPDWRAATGRPLASLLGDPPFVERPEERLVNYWMMSKRLASLPYVIFASGLSFVGLAVFVFVADVMGVRIGVFRTFGMNALIAYILHKMVLKGLMFPLIPPDSAAWLYWSGLLIYLVMVYLLVRGLERQGVFVKI
ncbi:MAG: hypothetical protein KF861_03270 [Planctomycetaceae bacterium]|nr:hypothetical protein [Planctomycetaceae bacterium]